MIKKHTIQGQNISTDPNFQKILSVSSVEFKIFNWIKENPETKLTRTIQAELGVKWGITGTMTIMTAIARLIEKDIVVRTSYQKYLVHPRIQILEGDRLVTIKYK